MLQFKGLPPQAPLIQPGTTNLKNTSAINDTANTTTRQRMDTPNNVKKIPNAITIPLPNPELLERFVTVLMVAFYTIVVITILAIFGFIQHNQFNKLVVRWGVPNGPDCELALAIGTFDLFRLALLMFLAVEDKEPIVMQLHNFSQLPPIVWFMAGLAGILVAQAMLEVAVTILVRYCMSIWSVMRCLLQE